MMNKTNIEWVQNPGGGQGFTWNPITGCLNHTDGMCKGGNFPCYAYGLANGRLWHVYTNSIGKYEVAGGIPKLQCKDPFFPRFWPEKLEEFEPDIKKAARGTLKRKGVFCCSMSDLFGNGVPFEWTDEVMNVIEAFPMHCFYLLTKQPQNLIKFSPFPVNARVGVTATNNYTYLGDLQAIEAKVKYVSFEPLLDWRDFPAQKEQLGFQLKRMGINWIIIGAQTKPTVMPKIEWVQEIVEAADKAGIPVFLKDSLAPLLPPEVPTFYGLKLRVMHDDGEPEYDPILRQEMPE